MTMDEKVINEELENLDNEKELVEKGSILAATGEKSLAIKFFDKALRINPELDEIRLLRVLISDKYQEALEDLTYLIAKDYETSSCYFYLGLAYYNLGEYEKAIEYYTKSTKLRLSNIEQEEINYIAETIIHMGLAYLRMNNIDKAVMYFCAATLLDKTLEKVSTKIFEYCCNDTALAENILQAVQTASIKIGSTLIETNSTVEMFIQYLLEPESENDISHDTEHITNKIRKIDL